MKWAIIILVMMSLVGSMMWVLPSKRERFQAQLRQLAMRKGFNVQLAQVKPPRASGEIEQESFNSPVYRLPRTNISRKEREGFIQWQVYKQVALAAEGLPEGWCWGEGERKLSESQLEQLSVLISDLPEGAVAIESDPVHLSVFWDERGDLNDLDRIQDAMQSVIEEKF
ncbi:hypothetical protein [Aliamphritea spongicola]|uniref:hypothetical protein n=1 Tax=Aliamphritea spongicola TaxID=707589 RepID=UPI00196AA7CB|nr:hypothetical protein [Aliamphritea spongicola]MBN3560559.1 hypothetical protein [Aliamphritea spongicola]